MCRLVSAFIILSLAGIVPGLAANGQAPMTGLPLSQLESRLADIDRELGHLARYSLRGGVGPIGYRSTDHASATNTEWAQVDLGREAPFDEIVLAPAIWRDTQSGFRADGFPVQFQVIAGTGTDMNGKVLASFAEADHLLPRIAPLIIPCPGTTAAWVRVEATFLSPRAYDGRYNLELAEILVFDGQDNIALKRPVRVSSDAGREGLARHASFLTDGFMPYLMHSAQGKSSTAYLSPHGVGQHPALTLDLGAAYPLSQLNLHAIDVDDSFPQANPYGFGLPLHFTGMRWKLKPAIGLLP
jgi:hypothetical protein